MAHANAMITNDLSATTLTPQPHQLSSSAILMIAAGTKDHRLPISDKLIIALMTGNCI